MKKVTDKPSESGWLDSPVDMSHIDKNPPVCTLDTPPSAWDWRAYNGVTPVKAQGQYGTCWAFAGTGSLESNVLINSGVNYNFAEMELIHCNFTGRDCENGGNAWHVVEYYSLRGTSVEACNPYSACDSGACQNCSLVKQLTEWQQVCDTPSVENGYCKDVIKDALYNIGPVFSSMFAGGTDFEDYDGSYVIYKPGDFNTTHAVLIVGYDDNMVHAGGTGGWIVKNSWGTNWGDNGYFRIAYGSRVIGSQASVFSGYKDFPNGQVTIAYDDGLPNGGRGYGDENDWGAMRFSSPIDGYVTYVGFWAKANSTAYTIKVYNNWNNGSPTVQLGITQTGTVPRAGYYSIKLDSPIPISAGAGMVLLIGLNTPGYSYPITYDDHTPFESNKSFSSNSGADGTWTCIDAGGANYGDIAFRAFIRPVGSNDNDQDGIPNFLENGCLSPDDPDSDNDGLCDGNKAVSPVCVPGEDLNSNGYHDSGETNPCASDTDNDALTDFYERLVQPCLDPLDPDTDDDVLTDGEEISVHNTNPCNSDTDGGGAKDGFEVACGRDPLIAADDRETAVFNGAYQAPHCSTGKSPCYAPDTLIDSCDNYSGKAEPNQPNTINDSCADGSGGTYHNSESIDAIKLTDLVGCQFLPGHTVKVEATVYAYSIYSCSKYYIYYSESALSPSWNLVGSGTAPGAGVQTISATFQLGATPGAHAVRVIFGYFAAASSCSVSAYTDRDDLIFKVDGPPTCALVSIDQANPFTMSELASQTFTATCTMSDLSTQNCTGGATWSKTGNVTRAGNTITATHIPCAAGGSGTVTATVASCAAPSDTHNLTVTNDDAQTAVACTPNSVTEASSGALTCAAIYGADACQDLATCTVGGPAHCGGAPDNYAIANVCGNGNPADCVITCGAFTDPLVVTDDGDVVLANTITPDPGSLNEGATLQFTLTRYWSDGCVDNLTNSATWSSAAGCGAIASSTGLYTAPADDGLTLEPRCTDTISATSPVSGPVNVTVHSLVIDSDGDGLSDALEGPGCTDPQLPDSDGDGLCDGSLTGAGCMAGEDIDDDGVLDPGETNPCNADSDDDGVNDGDEVLTYNTNPNSWDTDGDYLPDPFEIANAANPAGPLDATSAIDGDTDFEPAGQEDGNPNFHEYWNGSDLWAKNPVPDVFASPACYYWAEGDGDGVPGPGDLSVVKDKVASGLPTYMNVLPRGVFDTQDIDKDGVPGPGDISAVKDIVVGVDRASGYPASPVSLGVVSAPGGAVEVGDTCHVTVEVVNQALAVTHSGAFAVVFSIDPSSTGSAVLLGGEGEDLGQAFTNRYDVSGPSLSGGRANIVLKVTGAGTVIVRAKIPACGTGTIGRWCSQVLLSPSVTITVQ